MFVFHFSFILFYIFFNNVFSPSAIIINSKSNKTLNVNLFTFLLQLYSYLKHLKHFFDNFLCNYNQERIVVITFLLCFKELF